MLSHDGLLVTNLATAIAVSVASAFVFTKIVSWSSSYLQPKRTPKFSEHPKENPAEPCPEEPKDDVMATDALTSRPQRSSTLRAVIIPEASSPGLLEVPKKDSGATNLGFSAEDQFDVYSAFMRLLSDDMLPVPVAAILVLSEVVTNSK
ncbi:hypothetical protein FRB90_007328, partial [Tulasnella sp. 427]